ncbi:MAG: murein L,D-transpeptidase [Verrucomicrobia bacterium]|nr:murein L,D-transpeptidase [Verrucomicrobiota bacterium]
MHDPKNRGLFTITARAQTNTPTLTTLTATPTRTNAASPISTNQSKPTVLQRTNTPVAPSPAFPRPPKDVLEAQVALMRHGISPGSIDGVNGSQTRAALVAFQKSALLTMTGELDATTRTALVLDSPPFTNHIVTSNDLARLQPVSKTWLGKSQQTALDYETIIELVAEQGHASPNLIKRLNPSVDWTNVVTGTEIKIPDAVYPPAKKAAFATIRLAEKQLQVFDASTNLLAHFPCSIAQRVDKRPVGELHIVAVAPNPDYTFNPEVFPESPEAQQLKTKLILPPGPNNPVGTAWISLDKPGYGMHGTPKPEDVGRTESHGCFRLANWNADFLIKMVWVGMPVYVEP